jgi:hypothetical protein
VRRQVGPRRRALPDGRLHTGLQSLPTTKVRSAMRREGVVCIALARERAQLGPPQPGQVVGQANQCSLRTDLRQPAKSKAVKPAPLFDLFKHRLHNRLVPLVHGLPGRRSQLLPHLRDHPATRLSRSRDSASLEHAAMLLPVRRQIEIHAASPR